MPGLWVPRTPGPSGESGFHAGGAGWRAGRLALRLAGALFLVATGAEHLELSVAGGYGHIPTIGTLFVLQAAVSFAIGAVVLVTPLPVASLGGALFALATLGGYLLSLTVGLFGFHEVVTAAGVAAGLMDIAAFSILGSLGLSAPAPVSLPRPVASLAPRVVVAPVALAAAAAFVVALALASRNGGVATAAGADLVGTVTIPRYGTVLVTAHGRTLYLLSSRGGAQVPCRGGCLSIWPPLLAAPSVRDPRGGPGVRGTLGLAPRGGGRQLTYNGYRLYTYAGDAGPGQSNGERIASFGGTWYLVRAAATSAASTAVKSTS